MRQHDWTFVFIPSPQTRPRLQGSKAVRLATREFDHSGCSNGGSGKANIAYLISYTRPMAEVLLPGRKNIADLPAVRWKQRNLDQLAPGRRDHLVEGLRAVWPS